MIVVSDAWVGHALDFDVKRLLRANSTVRMSNPSVESAAITKSTISTIVPTQPATASQLTPTTTTAAAAIVIVEAAVTSSVHVETPTVSTISTATTTNTMKTGGKSVTIVSTPPPKLSSEKLSQQQQFGNNHNNKNCGTARAVLICQQNSHPFQTRNILLETNDEVKIGRSITRNRINEYNAVFDCKVLSRNHAIMWYSDGKFFIKDAGSSNGTFINNQRLSQTNEKSEPFEVRSGDIVQFGVDVMENSMKEAHGCIVALLKLYLPDGNETQSSFAGAGIAGVPSHDLFQLNQCIQEAVQREQMLDLKLLSIQKIIDTTRKNSANSWQAMIVEDRLLSRIDILENKLQCFQKNVTEDKLREEVLRLQDDKSVYQNSAKEALRKVYQERNEAVQKLSVIERALCSSEDECSLLRDQLLKTQQQVQDVSNCLSTKETKFSDMTKKLHEAHRQIAHLEQTEAKICSQLKQLTLEHRKNCDEMSTVQKQNSDLMAQIKCYENIPVGKEDDDDEEDDEWNYKCQDNQKWDVMSWLNTDKFEFQQNAANNTNSNAKDESKNNVHSFEPKCIEQFYEIEKHLTVLEKQFSLNNGGPLNSDGNQITELAAISDGNQNNQHCLSDDNYHNSLQIIKGTIAKLKDAYGEFCAKRISCDIETLPKEKFTELEAKLTTNGLELQAAKLELETRPTYNQYQEKIKQKDDLQEELVNATVQISQLQFKVATLEEQLTDLKMSPICCDIAQQTDSVLSEDTGIDQSILISEPTSGMVKSVSSDYSVSTVSSSEFSETTEPTAMKKDSLTNYAQSADSLSSGATNLLSASESTQSLASAISDLNNDNDGADDNDNDAIIDKRDIHLMTDSNVQLEEELIIFKERCAQLTEDLLCLRSKINQNQLKASPHYSTTTLFMMLTPLIAFISYLFISPYL